MRTLPGRRQGSNGGVRGNSVDLVFADVGEALDDLEGEGGGADVEALAGLLTEQAKVVGGGEDLGMDDLADDGGQAFEGGAEFAGHAGRGSWAGGLQPPVEGRFQQRRRAFLPRP